MTKSRLLPMILFITIFTSFIFPASAICGECNDVVMTDKITINNDNLILNGLGTRKATFFKVKVYVAGLYLVEQNINPEQIISQDQPRHLTMKFLRNVKMKDIGKGWREGFAKNNEDISTLQTRIDQLNNAMQDMNKGDSMTFSYSPGTGTSIHINQEQITTIKGKDFASALIAIWLGEPPNKEIKTGLLGGKC